MRAPIEKKFRSVKAFRSFEQRERSSDEPTLDAGDAAAATTAVSPLRVLAAVKAHADGVTRRALVAELGAAPDAVEAAVLRLMKEDLVRLKVAPGSEEVLLAS